jgi:hypothetical protein
MRLTGEAQKTLRDGTAFGSGKPDNAQSAPAGRRGKRDNRIARIHAKKASRSRLLKNIGRSAGMNRDFRTAEREEEWPQMNANERR